MDHVIDDGGPSTILTLFGSFLKGASFLGSAYVLGYFNCSPSWVMLAVTVWILRDKMNREKKRKLAIGRESVHREKETILARLDDLPSWVFFPDVERAEWLNKILHKLWPYVGDYTRDLIRTSIEPSIRDNLPSYLKSFKFETINLGHIPLRVGGVKIYSENVARGEIVMDMEICYAGDCDFVVKVKSFRAGIKHLQIHGTMRVIMKPLVKQIPLIGGITVFFLSNPAIDFNLTNIADILDMPGLSDTLRGVITEQIAAFMVLPNKFSMPLIADLPSKMLKFTPPAGMLQIQVIEARDLHKGDISLTGKGKSDPYAVIRVGAQTFKSQVIDNTVAPYWNYNCEAVVDQASGQNVDVDVYDEDPGSSDDFLGSVFLDVTSTVRKGIIDSWIPLDSAKTGEIHVKTMWKQLSDSVEDYSLIKKELELDGNFGTLSSAILLIYVDSAKKLPLNTKTKVPPSPKVKLSVGSTDLFTSAKYNTQDPVWEEQFRFLLVDPEVQTLYVEVFEQDKEDKPLGNLKFLVSSLMSESSKEKEENFKLGDSGRDSSINLTLKLQFLKQASVNVSPASTSSCCESDVVNNEPAIGIPAEEKETAKKDDDIIIKPAEPKTFNNRSPSPESTLRHRNVVPSDDIIKCGLLQLTLRYSDSRNMLVVVVHKVVELIAPSNDDQPDPYVKLILLPEKSKESKQKTPSVKNTLNPVYDQTFEFMVSHLELGKYSLFASVNSKSSGGVFSKSKKSILGQVLIPLHDVDLNKASTEWHNLQPRSKE